MRHWEAHEAVLRVRNLAAEEGDRRFRRIRLRALSPVVESLAARVQESQKAGHVSAEISPWAAASSLAAMLERMSAYHSQFEHAGIARKQLVETCARILSPTVNGRQAA